MAQPFHPEAVELQSGIARIMAAARANSALPGQPFDGQLLQLSALYRRSRALYLKSGGKFAAALVSSARALGSASLLEPMIEYSPIENELVWAATDPIERKNPRRLLETRTYATSVFHEQSHRILWRLLPPAPRDAVEVRRYLNFAESLVIAMDMRLGDSLGPLARTFYLCGATYDPGTDLARLGLNRRMVRNYLQAALYATYLNLELFKPRQIPRVIRGLYPMLDPHLANRASARALALDRGFIVRTNLAWQRKNQKAVLRSLSGQKKGEGLRLPPDPLDHRLHYLWAERWFDLMKV